MPRPILIRAGIELMVFSTVINLLQLISPIYLLQIYDRIIPSGSQETLAYLSIMAGLGFLIMGSLEAVRAFYGHRLVSHITEDVGQTVMTAVLAHPRHKGSEARTVRDLQTLRNFVEGRAAYALFDLPFAPLFAALLYFVHPVLFYVTIAGAAFLFLIAVLNQFNARRSINASGASIQNSAEQIAGFARDAESLRALGMVRNATARWASEAAMSASTTDSAARIAALLGGLSRSSRMVLQIATLGVGAYLVLRGEMSAGMIFAASIVSGRVLQPIDQIIASAPMIAEFRRASSRLSAVEKDGREISAGRFLDQRPKGEILFENVVYRPQGAAPTQQPIIKGISFGIRAGSSVAVVGPSGAGKSTLGRIIVGAVAPSAGAVRIDGAGIETWGLDGLGKWVGYLAQDVVLFPGTVAENIARFEPDGSQSDIVDAARAAGAERMIMELENGFDSEIRNGQTMLSGGESQRIGLARALFGNPAVVVLDEPNANLDAAGEQALVKTIGELRGKATLVVITHKPSIAALCDQTLVLNKGKIEAYGPTAKVMAGIVPQQVTGKPQPRQPAPPAGNGTNTVPARATPAATQGKQQGEVTGSSKSQAGRDTAEFLSRFQLTASGTNAAASKNKGDDTAGPKPKSVAGAEKPEPEGE